MFEKELEEYKNQPKWKGKIFMKDEEICFKDGAEFGYNKANEQVIKAKELIKKFSEFVNNEVEFDPEHPQEHTDLWNELCEEAEQFIKEMKND